MAKFLIFDLTKVRVGTYLAWFFVAVALPLLFVIVDLVWQVEHTQRLQQEAVLVNHARDAAQLVDRTVEHVESQLRVLAGSSALRHGGWNDFRQEMLLVSDQLSHIQITLTAPDGNLVLQVGDAEPNSSADELPVRQAALAAIEANDPVITNLLMPDDAAHRAVAFAVPGFRPGESAPAFVLVGSLGASQLARLATLPPSYPFGMVLTIHDRNGITVARSVNMDLHMGDPASPEFLASTEDRQSGIVSGNDRLDEVPVIRAFSKAPISGYTVVAALPVTRFGQPARSQLIDMAATGAALLALSLFATTLLARGFVGKLRAVEQEPRGLVPGDLHEVDELTARYCALSTERDASQARLQDSERRLRTLSDTLDLAAVIVHDVNGTIQFWSYGCVRMYGWTQEGAVGQVAHEILRTEFPVPLAEIEHTLLTRGEWKGDLVQRRRDGASIIVAAHRALQHDIAGRPHAIIDCLVEVTALRDAQDALRKLEQTIEQRVRAEVAAREAAQQRAAHAEQILALGQLAGGIAHEFNNVLQAVAGGAELIARRPNDAEGVCQLVQVIGIATARGATITQRMLVLARRSDLKTEPVDAATLLDEMREIFIQSFGPAIDVEVQAAFGIPRLLADKVQLKEAIVNLATNARDAMPKGGVLQLLAGFELVTDSHPAGLPRGAYVRISVVDEGTGMTEASMARIGEPFFTTKEIGKGTGLGLSMVQGFTEQSAGGFVIESAVGVGTRATLWLPAVPSDARQWMDAADQGRSRATGRILVVDDDKLVRDTLQAQLEQLGHKVQAAADATDALAILRARKVVDVMITDLSMPGMNGLMLIKEAHGLRPTLPAILLTGYAVDAGVVENDRVADGTYTLMRKPASSALLSARVRTLLEQL